MDKTVGVLGGGQLGRMLAEAASLLDIKVLFLDKEGAPAKQTRPKDEHVGSFKDADAIQKLAAACDVLTIEIEHVGTDVLRAIEEAGTAVVEPSSQTIRTIQDKYEQKLHLQNHGVAVADSVELLQNSKVELQSVGQRFQFPFMLKTKKEAYDGRGNCPISGPEDFDRALKALGDRELYAERWAYFEMELAVMVVRTATNTLAFPTVETIHENSICKLVYAPARGISSDIASKAQALAKKAVGSFKGKGVYGVEMFLLDNDDLLINEIAPRPHNSGHYTIEACPMSQYEAHLHAILDLPIPERRLRLLEPAIMLNILGGKSPEAHLKVAEEALSVDGKVHIYGKGAGTPGRKMGHITLTAPTMAEAEALMEPLIHAVDIVSGRAVSPYNPKPLVVSKKIKPVVAVIMGSDSDLPTLQPGLDILEKFSIPFTARVTSAHRTPRLMAEFSSSAAGNGLRVIIAAAGGAAHLPGMAAAHTPLPVIGVPVKGSTTDGMDSLLSIVQMPRGVPVATVGIGNAVNAALLAARILGVSEPRIQDAVEKYAKEAASVSENNDKRLQELGYKSYAAEMPKK
jgi:phosphoribosylaminoimidazole carboxylase